MSLPTPNTRKEQYLNAIATGNASGLPTPITREEEYLEAIAKSGGGSGEGDMKKSVYDSDLDVAGAGGIKAFVNSAVAGKVDKVEGKGLSTNDYDDTEKGKVADNTEAITANTSAIEATQDMISDAYDSTQTYNVGDYCIHENALYKCNTASTTGTWDSSKWDAVTVADEIGELTDAVTEHKVSVVGDGVKTIRDALYELYGLVNRNKLNPKSVFYYKNTSGGFSFYLPLIHITSSKIQFGGMLDANSTEVYSSIYILNKTLSYNSRYDYTLITNTIADESTSIASVSHEFGIIY